MSGWVGHLAAVVVLAGVADLLMPRGALRPYARTVLGMVVLLAVLQPLLSWLHQGVQWSWTSLPPPPDSVAQEGALTREVYRQLLQSQVDQVAREVPGVAGVASTVTLEAPAPGAVPAIRRVEVTVSPAAAARPGAAPAPAGPPAGPPSALAARVQQRVAAALDLRRAAVAVRMAPSPAPAPG